MIETSTTTVFMNTAAFSQCSTKRPVSLQRQSINISVTIMKQRFSYLAERREDTHSLQAFLCLFLGQRRAFAIDNRHIDAKKSKAKRLEYSGGEKQRVSCARAMVKGGAVFVMDEGNSTLDRGTEVKVQSGVLEEFLTKTVINVAISWRQSETPTSSLCWIQAGQKKQEVTPNSCAGRPTFTILSMDTNTTKHDNTINDYHINGNNNFSERCIFQHILNSMAKIIQKVRYLLKKFDLFPSSQYLRYRQEPQFKTATGGFVSVAVIILFIILFYNMGMQTLNQELINGSVSYTMQVEPQRLPLRFQKGTQFMFGIGIVGLNLSNPAVSFFNITMRQNYYSPVYQLINTTAVPLVMCTPQHFSYNEEISKMYYQFAMSMALCPPLNYDFSVSGRAISDIYAQITIDIEYCNKTIDSKCLTDTEMDQLEASLGGFNLLMPTISTIINPGDKQYKQVYLEDRNYYYFSKNLGLWANGQIQQYQVDTDISLLPYTNIKTEKIPTIPNLFHVKTMPVFNNIYAQVVFSKASTSTVYTRSFNKLDDYLSYVGGLISSSLVLFFLLHVYSEKCYVVEIASETYAITEDSDKTSFNFLYFVAIHVKSFLDFIGLNYKWQTSDRFLYALKEMQSQLSVEYLLKRINYLQELTSTFFSNTQSFTIDRCRKKTIEQAAELREKYQKRSGEKQNQSDSLSAGNMIVSPYKDMDFVKMDQGLDTNNKFSNIRFISEENNPRAISQSQQINSSSKKKQTQREENKNMKDIKRQRTSRNSRKIALKKEINELQSQNNEEDNKVQKQFNPKLEEKCKRQTQKVQLEDLE